MILMYMLYPINNCVYILLWSSSKCLYFISCLTLPSLIYTVSVFCNINWYVTCLYAGSKGKDKQSLQQSERQWKWSGNTQTLVISPPPLMYVLPSIAPPGSWHHGNDGPGIHLFGTDWGSEVESGRAVFWFWFYFNISIFISSWLFSISVCTVTETQYVWAIKV